MVIQPKTIELICHFESLHDGDLSIVGLQPKLCPADVWTEGYGRAMIDPRTKGHLRGIANKKLAYELATIHTEEEARLALFQDLPTYEAAVKRMIKRRDLEPHQYGAAVAFAYNCGTHYKVGSGKAAKWVPYKLWSLIDAYTAADPMYQYWCGSVIKAGGKILPGLVRRRKSEGWLWKTGDLNFFLGD